MGDRAVEILLLDRHDLLLRTAHQLLLLLGHDHVVDSDRHARQRGVQEAKFLQLVQHLDRLLAAQLLVAEPDQVAQAPLLQQAVDEGQLLGQAVLQQHAPHRGLQSLLLVEDGHRLAHVLAVASQREVDHRAAVVQLDRRAGLDLVHVVGEQDVADAAERAARAAGALLRTGEVVHAQHHVLGGSRDRQSARWREDVVGAEHQHVRLDLRFRRQRHVHAHLVAVEVSVERRANQRVDLDRLALDQHRLERLNSQAVQRWRAVQQDRVILDHAIEDVPHDSVLLFDKFLGLLDRGAVAALLQPLVDERLVQF